MAFQKLTEYSDEQIQKMFQAGNFSAVVDGNKETRERIMRILKDGAKPQDQRLLELEEKNFRLEEDLDRQRRHVQMRVDEGAFYHLSPVTRDQFGFAVKLDPRFVKHIGEWVKDVMEYAADLEREVLERRAEEVEPVVLKSKYDRDLERTRRELLLAQKRYGLERDLRHEFYSDDERHFSIGRSMNFRR
jgi:hypothetical protein